MTGQLNKVSVQHNALTVVVVFFNSVFQLGFVIQGTHVSRVF